MAIVLILALIGITNKPDYEIQFDTANGEMVVVNNSVSKRVLVLTFDDKTNTYVLESREEAVVEFPYGAGEYLVRVAKMGKLGEPLDILSEEVVTYEGSFEEHKGKGYYTNLDVQMPQFKSVEDLTVYINKEYKYNTELDLSTLDYYKPDFKKMETDKTGICVDYASLMGSILRQLGYQVRFPVGEDLEGNYHMWVEVNQEGMWMSYDPTNGIYGDLGYSVEKYY